MRDTAFQRLRTIAPLLLLLMAVGPHARSSICETAPCSNEPLLYTIMNGELADTLTLESCVGDNVILVVTGEDKDYFCHASPPVYGDGSAKFSFSWAGASLIGSTDLTSTAQQVFTSPGSYTVSCEVKDVDDENPCNIANETKTVEWTVNVRPHKPKCPTDGSATMGCSIGGGGNGCSACGSGNLPLPSLAAPVIYPYTPPNPGSDGTNTGTGGCGQVTVKVVDSCEGFFAIIKKCGKCKAETLHVPQNSGDPDWILADSWDGVTIEGAVSYGGGSTFTITGPDGSQSKFELGPPSSETKYVVGPVGPSATFDSISSGDGTYRLATTYNRDANGTLSSVVFPNGETWNYEPDSTCYEPDNPTHKMIGRVTAPDGTVTDFTYETATGPNLGRLTSYTVSKGDESYTTSYGWVDGKLSTASRGNRTLTYTYPTSRKIVVTDSSSVPGTVPTVTEYDYGAEGSDTTTVTRKGTVELPDEPTVYTFYTDGSGVRTYLHTVTDPYGSVTTYNVNTDNGQVNSLTDPSGLVTEYHYNSKWAVTEVTRHSSDPADPTSSEFNSYYGAGGSVWLKTHTDVRGNYTHYYRDETSDNTLWRVNEVAVAPAGTEPNWDAVPRDSSIKTIKKYEYYGTPSGDPDTAAGLGLFGQVKREITPDVEGTAPQVVYYQYKDPVSGKTRNSPTLVKYQQPDGAGGYDDYSLAAPTVTSYDDMGRVLSTTDADSRTTSYEYDAKGRQTRTIYERDAGGSPLVYTENFYSCCTLDRSRDENGNYTYYDYDGLNRVIETWTDTQVTGTNNHDGSDPHSPLVVYTYDALGNKETVTTYSGASAPRVTTYTYDMNARVTKIVYPYDNTEEDLLGNEEFWYDETGNLQYKRDGNDKVTLYRYDGLNRLTNVYYEYTGDPNTDPDYPENASVTYGYDENGQDKGSTLKTSMTEDKGTETLVSSYTYNEQGRLETYTPPKPAGHGALVYTYNNLGQKISITTDNYSVSYDYYANGWLKDVNSGSQSIAGYSYDAAGNRDTVSYGNGTSTVYAYKSGDPRYLVDSITHKRGSTVLATIGYPTRDAMGDPESMADWTGTWTYDYDANNRLSLASPPVPVPDQPAGGIYGYDWVGNRLNPPADPNRMVYNKADELLTWPGMHTYSYYKDGSLNEEKDASGVTQRSYTYTDDGLLATATYPGGTAGFTWDADKNRVGMVMGGGTYSFVYDRTAGIPAVIEENDGANSVYYFREPSGSLLARLKDSDWRWYHFDELGSTRLLTDGNGVATDAYSYDAYGHLLSHTDPDPTGLDMTDDNPYQYVGRLGYYDHWQDADFGLLQLGVRFYEPQTGRFGQRDPTGYGFDAYVYVDSRPTFLVDPEGLTPQLPFLQCFKLLERIDDLYNKLQRRWWDMSRDRYHLYRLYCEKGADAKDPETGLSWETHQRSYCEDRQGLKTLLDRFKERCKCYHIAVDGCPYECQTKQQPPTKPRRYDKPCTPKHGRVSKYQNGCP